MKVLVVGGTRFLGLHVTWRAGLDPVGVSPFSGRWMSLLDPVRAEGELGFRATALADYLRVVVDAFLSAAPAAPPPAYGARAREVEMAGRGLAP